MEENNKSNRVNPGYFGPGVVGKEIYDAEQAVVEAGANIFGPGVTGIGLKNQAVNQPGHGVTGEGVKTPPPAEPPSLSIRELTEALEANPGLVDDFFAAEKKRPGGPRKGALQALEVAESLRPGGPREEVLVEIAAELNPDGINPHGLDEEE
jgi:hypothetical protein